MDNNPYSPNSAEVIAPGSDAGDLGSNNANQYIYMSTYGIAIGIACTILPVCIGYIAISVLETIGGLNFPGFADPNADMGAGLETTLVLGGAAIGVGCLLLMLIGGILVCMFTSRANANLRSFGARGMQFTPGWCIGYWFIPFANLFKPYQVMKEIYQCSQSPLNIAWMSVTPSAMLLPWWWTWILGGIIARAEDRAGGQAGMEMAVICLSWLGTLLILVSGILLVRIVFAIQAKQDAFLREQHQQSAIESNPSGFEI